MKKHLELSFIDNNILYNLIQRSNSNSKNKNNFIIYDMSGGQCILDKDFQNFLPINDQISKILLENKDESIKLADISKFFPKQQEELFSKSKRYFNFLLIQPQDSEFLKILNEIVISIKLTELKISPKSEEELKNLQLLNCGQIKIDCEVFVNMLEQKLQNNPNIEATCSDSVQNWRKTLSFYKVLKHNKINEIHFVRQSANSFFDSYQFMKNYFVNLHSPSMQNYPNDILYNRIYFGNWKHASNEEIINSIGITHIVNMTCEVDNYFANNRKQTQTPNAIISYLPLTISPQESFSTLITTITTTLHNNASTTSTATKSSSTIASTRILHIVHKILPTFRIPQKIIQQRQNLKINIFQILHIQNEGLTNFEKEFEIKKNISYLKINIDDEDTSNICQHFKETYQFIQSALKKPSNKILIHCAQGKSRSATIVCMYLMRTFKWTFEQLLKLFFIQTLKYAQDRREVANPNYGFVEQLNKFENNNCMFEGESLDELNQSLKQMSSLSQFDENEVNNSNSNISELQNVKTQQNQEHHKNEQVSSNSNNNLINHK